MDRRAFLGTLPAAAAVATGFVASNAPAAPVLPPDIGGFRFVPTAIEHLAPAIERLFDGRVGEMCAAYAEFRGDREVVRVIPETYGFEYEPVPLDDAGNAKALRSLIASMFVTFEQMARKMPGSVLMWRTRPQLQHPPILTYECDLRTDAPPVIVGYDFSVRLRCRAVVVANPDLVRPDRYAGNPGIVTRWPTPA